MGDEMCDAGYPIYVGFGGIEAKRLGADRARPGCDLKRGSGIANISHSERGGIRNFFKALRHSSYLLPPLRLKVAPSLKATVPLSIYVLHLHSLPELCLAHMMGDMRGSAE